MLILVKKCVLLIFRQKYSFGIPMVLQTSFILLCQAFNVCNMNLLFLCLVKPKQHSRFVRVWTRCESIQYDMATISQYTSISEVACATIIYLLLTYETNGYYLANYGDTTITTISFLLELL